MRRVVMIAGLAAGLALAGCRPFFYGGVVVFGPEADAVAGGGE